MEAEQFILGFIAGEGSFAISVWERDSGKIHARPFFKLGVDEQKIVREIYQEAGEIGGLTERQSGYLSWQVQSMDDVCNLRDWVNEHRGQWFNNCHKSEQFELWSEAVDIHKQDTITDNDRKRLVDLSYQIPRSNTKKIDREEWHQRIDDWEQHYCIATRDDGESCEMPVPEPDMLCHHHQ